MISVLVERWRPETHIFYLSVGKTTITLRDVTILTQLPLSGMVVTSPSPSLTKERIHKMLEVLPLDEAIIGSSVKLAWMLNTFGGP